MSTLYRLKKLSMRLMGPKARARLEEVLYGVLYRATPARRLMFFNSGYAPLSPALRPIPELAAEPYQAMLYEFALHGQLTGVDHRADEVIEIGCGLGGGLVYIAACHPGARLVGVDVDLPAVRAARRKTRSMEGLTIEQADGKALPYPDAGFDLVISIGAAGYIGIERFIAEAARILKPGGVISMTAGFAGAELAGVEVLLQQLAANSGLRLHRLTDITANVFQATVDDAPRRAALIRAVPPPFRSFAREWADLPGSRRFEQYRQGQRLDFGAVLIKAPRGSAPAAQH